MPRPHCLVGILKMAANPVPQSLKPVAQFLVISRQFSKRNAVVSYYSMSHVEMYHVLYIYNSLYKGLMYFVQQGISLCKGDTEAKGFLSNVMQELEEVMIVIVNIIMNVLVLLAYDLYINYSDVI